MRRRIDPVDLEFGFVAALLALPLVKGSVQLLMAAFAAL
jgi:hypothetical protein